MEEQISSAIQIAFDPRAEPNLKQQAFEYVNRLRQEPKAWQSCLSLFLQAPPASGSSAFSQPPTRPEVVRVFALEIVINAIQGGAVDEQGLITVKDQVLSYLERMYGGDGSPILESRSIENKMAQTITLLFSALYGNGWEGFFGDLLKLTNTSRGTRTKLSGCVFYLRVINSIHDEIGDQLLSRSRAEQDRANFLKDLVRQRDVQQITRSWQEILTNFTTTSDLLAELCLKAIGKWVSWVDISLVVNQQMLQLLFQQLERVQKAKGSEESNRARDAAVDVFTETISKKMPAADKVQMISFLNLEAVVSQLNTCPPLADPRSSTYDVDFAETVAKLVNAAVIEIVKALETESQNQQLWQKAEGMLNAFLPHLLRFFSDEYDEVCSTVINAMNDLLAFLRKSTQGESAAPQRAVMLLPILKAIFAKMRYDETSSWNDDDDQTDEAEFQELRRRLSVLQQSIAAADIQLYTDAIGGLVNDTFDKLQSSGEQLNWRDLDLALFEMFLFGDQAVKAGGLYQKNKVNSPAADKLVQMMLQMVSSNVGAFNHPAIQLQYMETCVRYSSFFEKNPEHIQPVLENFLRTAHSSAVKVKTRSWYLLYRFVRQLRSHIGNVAEVVVRNLQDLLVIQAEVASDSGSDDMSSEADSLADAVFQGQLYLYETTGFICGATSVPADKQVQYIQAVMQPLFSDIELNLALSKDSNNEQALLQIHHDVQALGQLARGCADWIPANNQPSSTHQIPPEVKAAFSQVSEITLLALASLNSSFNIRDAARYTFTRLISVVDAQMLSQLPRLVEGLLTDSTSKEEMSLFLRLLDQVIYEFKNEVFNFLDGLFTGVLRLIFSGISAPADGTDDEIKLAELKREYLNFLIVILVNDLGGVVISSANQPFFETVINTIEHFSKDAEDVTTAKMAFQVLTRMCTVWGGPNVVPQPGQANGNVQSAQPALPGFDQFMITRFSPLCWAMPMNQSFNMKDGQSRQVLMEAAALQKTIYTKTGQQYFSWLKDNELRNMGMDEAMINDYLSKLAGLDLKAFKAFFPVFIGQGGKV